MMGLQKNYYLYNIFISGIPQPIQVLLLFTIIQYQRIIYKYNQHYSYTEISLNEKEHFSFSNNNTNLYINEKGIKVIINAIFTDGYFAQKLSALEVAAQTIDVLLDNDISRKIMFQAIKGNPEYKEQMAKILQKRIKSDIVTDYFYCLVDSSILNENTNNVLSHIDSVFQNFSNYFINLF